jgi:hypothetical protein
MKSDPIRLRDDPSSPRELRDDLAALSSATTPVIAVASVLQLRLAIEAGAKLSAVGQATQGLSVAKELFAFKALPWILGALVVSSVGLGVVAGLSSGTVATVRPVRTESAAGVVVTPSASGPAVEADPVPVAPSAAKEAAEAPNEPDLHAPAQNAKAAAPAAAASDSVALEMADLVRLRQLEHSDPGAALGAADQGKRLFPNGIYDEDREAIAIGLLVKLGRKSDARRRASLFLSHYPHSPLAERVRLAMAD